MKREIKRANKTIISRKSREYRVMLSCKNEMDTLRDYLLQHHSDYLRRIEQDTISNMLMQLIEELISEKEKLLNEIGKYTANICEIKGDKQC